jgi:hypothetical protein
MTFQPTDIIVPILALDNQGAVQQFLGTGSFIGSPPLLLTAEHVIRDWPESFAITLMTRLDCRYLAKVVFRDASHDLALLKVERYEPPSVLSLTGEQSHQNQIMATFEYGTTRVAGNSIILSPATRLGNITRILNMTERYNGAGEESLSYHSLHCGVQVERQLFRMTAHFDYMALLSRTSVTTFCLLKLQACLMKITRSSKRLSSCCRRRLLSM